MQLILRRTEFCLLPPGFVLMHSTRQKSKNCAIIFTNASVLINKIHRRKGIDCAWLGTRRFLKTEARFSVSHTQSDQSRILHLSGVTFAMQLLYWHCLACQAIATLTCPMLQIMAAIRIYLIAWLEHPVRSYFHLIFKCHSQSPFGSQCVFDTRWMTSLPLSVKVRPAEHCHCSTWLDWQDPDFITGWCPTIEPSPVSLMSPALSKRSNSKTHKCLYSLAF